MKSIPFYLLFIFSLVFALTVFLTNNSEENISKNKNSSQYQPNLSLELTENEREVFTELLNNVRMSSQIMKELDMLLEEYQKSDEFEGAIEAMNIAHEETLSVVNNVLNDSNTENKELTNLQIEITKLLTEYTTGLSMQLEGFENGDSIKAQEGYSLTISAKEKFFKLQKEVEQI